ncbi:GtrA family protein [Maribellus mangrovi]|uniref:GtrA family protein n=1 Tax=Maribellus mangrovi TaxID=3133146 RepID=UPI0030EF466A
MRNLFEKIGSIIIRIVDTFYFSFLQFIPREIFRYAATGGANTLLDIILYFIVYQFILKGQIVDLGFVAISGHIAAFLFVFPITFSTGFFLAKYVTFTASILKGRIQLFRYLLSVGGSILLNYVFLKMFVEYFGWYAPLSKVITTILVVIYSYLAQRYFTFQTARQEIAG